MKRFISLSGGVESTTMCILYGADAIGIWADTGAEHQLMYDRIDEVEARINYQSRPMFPLSYISEDITNGLAEISEVLREIVSELQQQVKVR